MVGSPCSVVVNLLVYDIVVCEFELDLRYYVHFPTFIIGKDINLLVSPCYSQRFGRYVLRPSSFVS